MKKNTKRKIDKSSKERHFNEFTTFDQKCRNSMNQFMKKKCFNEFLKNETIVKN